MILEKDMRKLLMFSCLFTTYIVIGALVFQALEIGNEIKERSLISATREMLNEKYNITDEDWYKLESILKQRHSSDSNTTWSFGNAFIFAGSVVTTVGKLLQRLFYTLLLVSYSCSKTHQGTCYFHLWLMLSFKLRYFEIVAPCSILAYKATQLKSLIY